MFPFLFLCSAVIVANTFAACSPPITLILAFGHMYRKRGLQTDLFLEKPNWKNHQIHNTEGREYKPRRLVSYASHYP